MEWDVFISHASEDKDEVARPLSNLLQQQGLKVWFDEFSLDLGDSLRRSIDKGLAQSRFGVVIISPSFLRKSWPQWELDGLVARELAESKVILPVWHGVSASEVRAYSPSLADKLSVSSSAGLLEVARRVSAAVNKRRQGSVLTDIVPLSSDKITSTSKKQIIYCSRCGAMPGQPSSCYGYMGHDFQKVLAEAIYCRRCGSLAGDGAQCVGYLGHEFAPSNGELIYCARCGATPGAQTQCSGYLNHEFTS